MKEKLGKHASPEPTAKTRQSVAAGVSCPHCGSTDGFIFGRWEHVFYSGKWGTSERNECTHVAEAKSPRYVECQACGEKVPFKKAHSS